jgi:hypothetical protein
VENRFQSLPFKCNLQRYTTVGLGKRVRVWHYNVCVELQVEFNWTLSLKPPGAVSTLEPET